MHKGRNGRASSYTMVANYAYDDSNLTFPDCGLLGNLLRYSDGWRVTVDLIMKKHPSQGIRGAGKEAMLDSMKRLVRHGYVFKYRWRDERNRWHSGFAVYDSPATEDEILSAITLNVPSDAQDLIYSVPHLGMEFRGKVQTNTKLSQVQTKIGTDQVDVSRRVPAFPQVSPDNRLTGTRVPDNRLTGSRLADSRLAGSPNKTRGKTTERRLTPLPPSGGSAAATPTPGVGGEEMDERWCAPDPVVLAEAEEESRRALRARQEAERRRVEEREREEARRAAEAAQRSSAAAAYWAQYQGGSDKRVDDAVMLLCFLADPPEMSEMKDLVTLVVRRIDAGDTLTEVRHLLSTTDREAWPLVLCSEVDTAEDIRFDAGDVA